MDEHDRELMRSVARYLEHVNSLQAQELQATRTPLADLISEHLGTDAAQIAVVQETIANHRLVDADIALEHISAEVEGQLIGVNGGEYRHQADMAELISNPHTRFAPGPVDFTERPTGPDSTRRVVSMGVRLLAHDSDPIAVVQRAAAPQMGRGHALLEVLGANPETVSAFLTRLRGLMVEHSVLRGQVLSFTPTEFGYGDALTTFLPRPQVNVDEVILEPGALDEVVQHVLGIGAHRELLQSAHQHLKRGVLLYGPPGTGKTLTVRHLLTESRDTTAILLTGSSIRFVSAAAEIARTFAPSIVVLEDIDLVAMERHDSPQPLLFEVLEALDGLDGDADIAFVMTTNRVDALEQALAQRPGRVDLAVEIPLPALEERKRLYRHYAHELGFSEEALTEAAARSAGVTASFAKELVRSALLLAASRHEQVEDAHLLSALEELMSARNHLTRRMLGTDPEPPSASFAAGLPAEPAASGSYGPLAEFGDL